LDVKKRFSEEQIIGFLREAEAGMPVKDLCRKHGFSADRCLSADILDRHACIGLLENGDNLRLGEL
jgi:hypothetical protein